MFSLLISPCCTSLFGVYISYRIWNVLTLPRIFKFCLFYFSRAAVSVDENAEYDKEVFFLW